MKNFYLAVFGLFSIGAFAQNSPTWPSTGNVGIGTTSPTHMLEVTTSGLPFSAVTQDICFIGNRYRTYYTGLHFEQDIPASSVVGSVFRLRTEVERNNAAFIEFNSKATPKTTAASLSFGYNNIEAMRINQNGKVRIADESSDFETPDGYRLFVEDGILTEKVKVAIEGTANWADYVFADNYELMPLEEVEQFTKENKHLPNVPCAEDMVTEGLDVAKMDAKLLEKIEELTLYLIEQNKKLEEQNKKIEILQTELQQLKEQED